MCRTRRKHVVSPLAVRPSIQHQVEEHLQTCERQREVFFSDLLEGSKSTSRNNIPSDGGDQIQDDRRSSQQLIEQLKTKFRRFIQDPSFFSQCDGLDDCFKLLRLLLRRLADPPDANHPCAKLLGCFVQLLVDAAVDQVEFIRLRQRLTVKLLNMRKEDSFVQLGVGEVLKSYLGCRVMRTTEDFESFFSQSKDFNKARFIQNLKESIVFLEDQVLYQEFFVLNPLTPLCLSMMRFFCHTLQAEVQGRVEWLNVSFVTQAGKYMEDQDLLLFLKALCLFVRVTRELALQPKPQEAISRNGPIELDDEIYTTFRETLLRSLMKLLSLKNSARDVLTVVVQIAVHSLSSSTLAHWAVWLFHRLEWPKTKKRIAECPMSDSLALLKPFWLTMPTLSQISLLRHLLCRLPCLTNNDVEILDAFFQFFFRQISYEYAVQSLYAAQAIMTWMDHVPGWRKEAKNPKLFGSQLHSIVEMTMDYWDSPLKSLGTLMYQIWEVGLPLWKDSNASYTDVLDSLGRRPNTKHKFAAYMFLISLKGIEWFERHEPMFLQIMLHASSSSMCRHIVLQVLMHYIDAEYKKNESKCLDPCELWARSPGLSLILRQFIQQPCCSSFYNDPLDASVFLPKNPSTWDTPQDDFLIRYFIPALKRKDFEKLFHLWFGLSELDRQHALNNASCLCEVREILTPHHIAVLAALKESGSSTWVKEEKAGLILTPTPDLTAHYRIEIPTVCIQRLLLDANETVRSHAIATVCHSRLQAIAPSTQEWTLLQQFLLISVKGTSLRGTEKSLRCIQRFIHHVVESCQRAMRKNDSYDIEPFRVTLMLLVIRLSSTHSTPMTSIYLRVLVFMYEAYQTLVQHSCCTIDFSFMLTHDLYCQFAPFLLSSWEEDRSLVLKLLDHFPSSVTLQAMHSVLPSFFNTLTSNDCREPSGISNYILHCVTKHVDETMQAQKVTPEKASSCNLVLLCDKGDISSPRHHWQSSIHLIPYLFKRYHPWLCLNWCDTIVGQDLLIHNGNISPAHLFIVHYLNLIYFFIALAKQSVKGNELCRLSASFCVISCTLEKIRGYVETLLRNSLPSHQNTLKHCIAQLVMDILECFFFCIRKVLQLLVAGEQTNVSSSSDQSLDSQDKMDLTEIGFKLDCRGHMIAEENLQNVNENIHEPLPIIWMPIKYGGEALESLFQFLHMDTFFPELHDSCGVTPQYWEEKGRDLLALCLLMKHPAVTDRLTRALSAFSTCLASSINSSYKQIPRLFVVLLRGLVVASRDQDTHPHLPLPPPLRRSFSLGQTFVALLSCDISRDGASMGLLCLALDPILLFMQNTRHASRHDATTCASLTHCLNISRYLIRSGFYFDSRVNYLNDFFDLALHYSAYQEWTVRNAANLLFAATTDRLVESMSRTADDFTCSSFPDHSCIKDQFHRHSCRSMDFSFMCRLSYHHRKINSSHGVFYSCKTSPIVYNALKEALNPKNLHPDAFASHQYKAMNALLFLSRSHLCDEDPSLRSIVELWRDEAPNALTRFLASRLVNQKKKPACCFQVLCTCKQNNIISGHLAALLDHLRTFFLNYQATKELLHQLQNVLAYFTQGYPDSTFTVAPFNHALLVQCSEQIFRQITSTESLEELKPIVSSFASKITGIYLHWAIQDLLQFPSALLQDSFQIPTTFSTMCCVDTTSPNIEYFDSHSAPETGEFHPTCSSTTPHEAKVPIEKPHQPVHRCFVPGQSTALYVSILRFFSLSSSMLHLVKFFLSVCPAQECQKWKQESSKAFFFPFFKELFRVMAHRCASEENIDAPLMSHLLVGLHVRLEHFLGVTGRPLCCLSFLSCTAREKLCILLFKLVLEVFKRLFTLTSYSSTVPLLQQHETPLDHDTGKSSVTVCVVAIVKKIIISVLQCEAFPQDKVALPFSECHFFFNQMNTNLDPLTSYLKHFFQSSSLPTAHLTLRWRCVQILHRIGFPTFPLGQATSSTQNAFHFVFWTYSAFLLTDEDSDLATTTACIVTRTFFSSSFIQYLQSFDPPQTKVFDFILQQKRQGNQQNSTLLPNVCLFYLLYTLFLSFDHSRVLTALVSQFVQLCRQDELPPIVSCPSPNVRFQKEPCRSNSLFFLHSVYFVHSLFHSFSHPGVPQSCDKEAFHANHQPLLHHDSLMAWLANQDDALILFKNSSDPLNVYQAALHYVFMSPHEDGDAKKSALHQALTQAASCRGVIIPSYLDSCLQLTTLSKTIQDNTAGFPYEKFFMP